MENVNSRNELLIRYLCKHREAGLIGDVPTFSLEGRYRRVVYISEISIRLAVKSGCRQLQLVVSHAAFFSIDGLNHSGRSSVRLVQWNKRGGSGVSREAGCLRTTPSYKSEGRGSSK